VTELQLQESLLFNLNMQYGQNGFFWTNQSSGYFDANKKIFRKHTTKFTINGVSDILGIYKSRFVALEVKRPGELKWWLKNKDTCKLSDKSIRFKNQENFINKIIEHGGIAGFVSSIEEAENLLSDKDTL